MLLSSSSEFGLRDAAVGESRNQPKWLRKLKTAGLDDCVEDPAAAKDAICIENQARSAVDSLRKGSEHSGQAIVTNSPPETS